MYSYSLVAVDVRGDGVCQRDAAVAGQLLRRGELGADLNVSRLEAPARRPHVGPGVRGRVEGPHAVAALVAGLGRAALEEGQARRQVIEHVGARDVGPHLHRGLDRQHRHRHQEDCNARASSLHGCWLLVRWLLGDTTERELAS